jgi:oligoendopeptidase F
MTHTPTLPSWDLSDLYAGVDDPRIQQDLDAALAAAKVFQMDYQGKISGCTDASFLREALDRYEQMTCRQSRPGAYASLHYSADTSDPARGALTQKIREMGSSIATHLIFFELELGKISQESHASLIQSKELEKYRHYLEHERKVSKHYLSETEETVLEETANCRGRAFRRLFTEVTSRLKFPLVIDGEIQILTQSDLLARLYEPDRESRKLAFESLAKVLEENSHVLTFVHNTLLHEKQTMDRLRSFDTPEADRHLTNELPAQVVDTMVEVCVENFGIVSDYYQLKAKLLGISDLAHYDRYAPIQQTKLEVDYSKARDIVLEAFGRFSPKLRELTVPFFEKNWIDVPPRDGKRSGAFCAAVTPDHHPYVLLNYTGRARDVMTLAHELGHGVHDVMASKNHIFDFHPVLPLAETASTFGEMLVFDKLQDEMENDSDKLALLCEKIEDTFATVFRQVSMYRFEQKLHAERRSQGELKVEQINEFWQQSMQEMFGESLTLGPDHRWTWLYIPHIVNTPFYVYAYSFGELLVLSLYSRYRQEGEPFVDRYFQLLAAGGSQEPVKLLAQLGIDITQKSFWQGGCDLIKARVQAAKTIVERLSNRA